jgi:hypothetical protein
MPLSKVETQTLLHSSSSSADMRVQKCPHPMFEKGDFWEAQRESYCTVAYTSGGTYMPWGLNGQ